MDEDQKMTFPGPPTPALCVDTMLKAAGTGDLLGSMATGFALLILPFLTGRNVSFH